MRSRDQIKGVVGACSKGHGRKGQKGLVEAKLAWCAERTASKCMATHPTLINWPHVELRGLSTSKAWALFTPKVIERILEPTRLDHDSHSVYCGQSVGEPHQYRGNGGHLQ